MCIIEYGKDVAVPPQHLDVAFFVEVLENALRVATFQIEHIKFTMGSNIGENYCSQIHRVRIQYKPRDHAKSSQLSVIVKSILNLESTTFLEDLQVFLKEKITYNSLLPRLEVLLRCEQKLGACLYHSVKKPVSTLVFEDLSVSNFEMASRENGLDELHCRLVMRRLAQFHAASMVLYKMDTNIMQCYGDGILSKAGLEKDDSLLFRHFSGNITALIGLAEKWPGYESISKKLQNYADNVRENLIASQAPLANEIKVLNHGDLWVNNLLFKYDKSTKQPNVEDVIFIDYQMSIWGSPGIDLNYFFYTSLDYTTLTEKIDELIGEYHRELCRVLTKLNYDNAPSYEQIKAEVQRRAPYGFFANYGVFPTISMDKATSSDSNLENFADETFAKNKVEQIFSSQRLQKNLRYTLKHFNQMGIFD